MPENTESPIKLHHLRPAPGSKTAKTRVGRGEASKGKTAGRGTKGTGARKNVPATFEGGQMPLQMRLPKLKGFRNRNKVVAQVVNVGDLARLVPDGGSVGPAEQVARYESDFDRLAAGVRLQRDAKQLPEFTVPDGWTPTSSTPAGSPAR